MEAKAWRNVLVLQTSFIGDTVLTLPLVEEIRRRFPVERLTLMCSPASGQLLAHHPLIDELIVDDKKGADRGMAGLLCRAQALKESGYTIAVTPHKSFRSAFLLHRAGIPERVGFRQSKGWPFFNHRTDRPADRHDVVRNLLLLRAIGIEPDIARARLSWPMSESAIDEVEPVLRAAGIADSDCIVGINPGSVWPTKRWSSERFAALIDKLVGAFDCKVALFGGPEDYAATAVIMAQCRASAINLAGKFSLAQLPAAIARCRMFFTNDSGPMHIAVATGVPTVAVFCATTPALGFYPYSNNAVVVEKPLSCRPCTSHGGRRCPLGHYDCSQGITPETVLRAAESLWHRTEAVAESNGDSATPEYVAA